MRYPFPGPSLAEFQKAEQMTIDVEGIPVWIQVQALRARVDKHIEQHEEG